MIITSVKYQKYMDETSNAVKATINGEGNRHWQAIQEWVAEGNTIAEAD